MPVRARTLFDTKGVSCPETQAASARECKRRGAARDCSRAYFEVVQVFGYNVGSHQTVIDLISTPFGVSSHATGSRALVEALVDILGREPELAEFLAKRLCWSEHGDSL